MDAGLIVHRTTELQLGAEQKGRERRSSRPPWQGLSGCTREYRKIRHRSCCSTCTVGTHTARCEADHVSYNRRLRRVLRCEQRGSLTTCGNSACTRVSGVGHTTCCGLCSDANGATHTTHCSNRQNLLMMQQASPTTMMTTANGRSGDTGAASSNIAANAGETGGVDSEAGTVTIVIFDSESDPGTIPQSARSATAVEPDDFDADAKNVARTAKFPERLDLEAMD